ncbi:MAG: ester cyclase [Caulobacterales bacterium]
MNRTQKQSVERLLHDVWSQGDVSAALQLIAERYTVFHDPGDPWEGQVLDREGYVQRVLASRAPFPDQSFAIQSLFAENAKVAVTWLWKGTHRLPIAGIPATNRVIRMSGATVYSFVGEGIVGHWQISDRLGVFQQLTAKTTD